MDSPDLPDGDASSSREAQQPTQRPPQKLPWWKALIFSLVVVVLAFAIPEAILSALHYPPPPPKSTDNSPRVSDIFWSIDPDLQEKPFLHKELGTYFKVSTNSRSMRYGEIPVGRQPKTIRILALGDSTTFGWGVEQDQTYPAQLEKLLQDQHPEAKVEVIDGGVPGYTSFQGLNHFKSKAGAYEPDIILFGYIVQDARMVPISDRAQAIKAKSAQILRDNPLYRFNLYRLFKDKYALLRSYVWSKESDEKAGAGATPRVPLDDYRENIGLFKELADKQKSRLVLFGFPLEVVGYTKKHRDLLTQMSVELKLDHFDPSNIIAAEARQRTLYFPKDKGHPNADGCLLIAQQVDGFIEEKGLIAAAIAARR